MNHLGICASVLLWGGWAVTVGAEATATGPYDLEGRIETLDRVESHVERGTHVFMGERKYHRHWRVTLTAVVLKPPAARDAHGVARMVHGMPPEYYGKRDEMVVSLAPTIRERHLRKGTTLQLAFYRKQGDERTNRVSYQDAQVVAADQTKKSLGGGSFVEYELTAEAERLEAESYGQRIRPHPADASGKLGSLLLNPVHMLKGLAVFVPLVVAVSLLFRRVQSRRSGAGSEPGHDSQ